MGDTPLSSTTPTAGMKRTRDNDGDDDIWRLETRFDKKARPGSGDSGTWLPQDSVLNTPKSYTNTDSRSFPASKYDSDDQSSMMSEPGSPQDIMMSSGDEAMDENDDTITFLPSQQTDTGSHPPTSPWHARMQQTTRVPTPILPPPTRPGIRPMQLKTGVKQHIRGRHPQQNISGAWSSSQGGDHLEVPSPIDEDEVPTPPSAAEAAGSQLSMLTVNDMDVETSGENQLLPTISIEHSPSLPFDEQHMQRSLDAEESAIVDDFDAMDSSGGGLTDTGSGGGLVVRKQRQRSGALSSPHGSPSPVRGVPIVDAGPSSKRGFSMGFRTDCERCRMRVPGHMNHFVS